jgi:hypothetical protein
VTLAAPPRCSGTRTWHTPAASGTGGQAELHVWPGGFHGFDGLVPDAAIAPNASVSVGFQANRTGNTAKPTSFTLDGASCSTAR